MGTVPSPSPARTPRFALKARHATGVRSKGFVRAETCARRDSHFFNPAFQLRTTVIGADAASAPPVDTGRAIRNRCPSGETA